MTRLILASLLLATPALGQDHPPYRGPHGAPDILILERLDEGYATLTYWNSGDDTSQSGVYPMSNNGLEIDVRVTTHGTNLGLAESIVVIAPEGWVAIPGELYVLDGEEGVVEIIRGGMGM